MRATAWQARLSLDPASGGLAHGGVAPTPAWPSRGPGRRIQAGRAGRLRSRPEAGQGSEDKHLAPGPRRSIPPRRSSLPSVRIHVRVGSKGRRRACAEAPSTPGPSLSVASVYPVQRKTSVHGFAADKALSLRCLLEYSHVPAGRLSRMTCGCRRAGARSHSRLPRGRHAIRHRLAEREGSLSSSLVLSFCKQRWRTRRVPGTLQRDNWERGGRAPPRGPTNLDTPPKGNGEF